MVICRMATEESEMQLLLKERSAAHNSVMMADEYLKWIIFFVFMDSQASESHSQLLNQRR